MKIHLPGLARLPSLKSLSGNLLFAENHAFNQEAKQMNDPGMIAISAYKVPDIQIKKIRIEN